MKTIKEKLIENELAEGTANLYITKLRKLNNDTDFNTLTFLKDTQEIKKKIESLGNKNTKKSYITSIVSILNVMKIKQYEKINIVYKAYLNEQKEYFNSLDHNKKTETQKENWVEWNEIVAKYDSIEEQAKKLTKEDMGITKNRNIMNEYMILSFYVLSPPRRNADYYLMKLTNEKHDTNDYNYYDMKDNKFYFNKFKTSKYGKESFSANDKLKEVLKFHINVMEIKNGDYILFKNDENRKSSSIMTKTLNKIFGKKIGASMLRHIYLSAKYGAVEKEMEQDAEMMSHSKQEQSNYIKK